MAQQRPGGDGDDDRPEQDDDLLTPYWAVMRRMRGADRPREPQTPQERLAQAHPGELVIATANRVLVRIGPDGAVAYEEGATPDDAARALWEAVARRRADFDRRMRYLELLELHIALIFLADQAYEAAQLAARAPTATAADQQREELSRRSLEVRVHGIIEFAREFALLRPDLIDIARRGLHQG